MLGVNSKVQMIRVFIKCYSFKNKHYLVIEDIRTGDVTKANKKNPVSLQKTNCYPQAV